ncbi:MAG: hypothetical protein SFU83_17320 [Meiothermus sp.]|nr:hypothetical protein [Meiothermus sp.]
MKRTVLALTVLTLAACAPGLAPPQAAGPRYDLLIQNRCTGANQSVYLYINNRYFGLVRGSRTFTELRPGFYDLRAVGTGNDPETFTRQLNLTRDSVWTLCL